MTHSARWYLGFALKWLWLWWWPVAGMIVNAVVFGWLIGLIVLAFYIVFAALCYAAYHLIPKLDRLSERLMKEGPDAQG